MTLTARERLWDWIVGHWSADEHADGRDVDLTEIRAWLLEVEQERDRLRTALEAARADLERTWRAGAATLEQPAQPESPGAADGQWGGGTPGGGE